MKSLSVWPTTDIVDAAINSPSNMAPASPMKILAGWKLWGRNPTHIPTMITENSGPDVSWTMVPVVDQLVGVEEEGQRGDGHDPGGQPVQAVDEVDGVGHAHDPQHGQHRHQVRRQDQSGADEGTRKNSMLMPNR